MISIMSDWSRIFEKAPLRHYDAGSLLFCRSDVVHSIFLVKSGEVSLERSLDDGTPLTLHKSTVGTIVADASLFAERYHCDGLVTAGSTVSVLPRSHVLKTLQSDAKMAISLFENHASEVQRLRSRIEIMRRRRVSERLSAWIELYGEPAKGGWSTVAAQIGVSPAALYRELAQRKRLT